MAESTAQTYRTAAKEHLDRADRLFESGDYFLAHFIAGLAVECHLRAHLRKLTPEWDPRHDLGVLAKACRFYNVVPDHRAQEFSSAFTLLSARWRSNHRFYSDRLFLDFRNEPNARAKSA